MKSYSRKGSLWLGPSCRRKYRVCESESCSVPSMASSFVLFKKMLPPARAGSPGLGATWLCHHKSWPVAGREPEEQYAPKGLGLLMPVGDRGMFRA